MALPRSRNIFPLNPGKAFAEETSNKSAGDFMIDAPKISAPVNPEDWINAEGQLSVDVYETDREIVVRATIAGVTKDDLDIALHNETLTIRGKRSHQTDVPDNQFYYRECYWGDFSRTIILPVDVKNNDVDATLENGVLTIVMPKSQREKNMKINIKQL